LEHCLPKRELEYESIVFAHAELKPTLGRVSGASRPGDDEQRPSSSKQ